MDASSSEPSQPRPLEGLMERRRIAGSAIVATVAIYGGYALAGALGLPGDLRYLGLVAAFYFVPGLMLRGDPERQRRYQVGPDGVLPRWDPAGGRWAAVAMLTVFPPFTLAFFWFYAEVCRGELRLIGPVSWLEGWTPLAGSLEAFLSRLCQTHGGGFWPETIRAPEAWLAYGGLGTGLAVAVEIFAIALPEEVFHRGYLMSALDELWPPRRQFFGAALGIGAIVSSSLFALGHLVGMAEAARLATFFPALVFAWLWRKSHSLWAPALFHAGSNLLMAILLASTFS